MATDKPATQKALDAVDGRLVTVESFKGKFTITPELVSSSIVQNNKDIVTLKEKFEDDRNRVTTSIGKLTKSYVATSKTYATWTHTDALFSTTKADLSATRNYATAAAAGATAAFAGLAVGITMFKIDERGITILGATRKWEFKGWRKTFFDWLDEKMQNSEQRAEAQALRRRNDLVDHYATRRHLLDHYDTQYRILQNRNWAADVNKIDRMGRSAQSARTNIRTQLGASPAPSLRSPAGGGNPDPRAVANEVRVLRSTLNQLISALA
ncbi:hypothetical protein ABZ348_25470 [Streptomyces sp. NPDC005963]|uniref:hypothetical protein n=1 Tax=Streptomyces sp. NPDC005963 TaxID=3156721 RepID=UPI0033FDD33B